MLGKITLAAGLLAAATVLAPYGASAISLKGLSGAGENSDLVLVKSKKGGGGSKHHHRRRHRDGVGGAIILGLSYCAIQSATCADAYGEGTRRYYRCMARRGC
jgi:hypothetical protein